MTSPEISKVCIYGAGAIGGWLGARLAASGCKVSVVARGATLAALQQHGLRLSSAAEPDAHARWPVVASASPADLGVQDLVVVAVKAPAMRDVARNIAPLIGPQTTVLSALNGVPWWFFQGFGGALQGTRLKAVDASGEIGAAIPPAQLMGCVVHASCSLDGPGQVRHHAGQRLIIGEPGGQPSERARQVAALLSGAGFDLTLSEQIQKDVWYKLWGNMTMNPISALTGATMDRILDDPLLSQFIVRVMLEAREIGAAIGIPIAERPQDRQAVTRKLGAIKTSMLQDTEAGKPVELDALVTAVQELGQLTKINTPWIDTLLGLARLQAQVKGLY
jgi:2-dehydropantoate 2-reductase